MKKLVSIVLSAVVLISITAVVYAKELEFNDGVYRGDKWEFEFGQPKKKDIIIIPQDRPEPKAYENGCAEHVEIPEKEYEIILLDD